MTTRDRTIGLNIAGKSGCIIVPYMTMPEASSLFWSYIDASMSLLEDDLKILLKALDFLPLAISQAATFINQNGCTLKEYLEMLQGDELEVHDLLSTDLGDVRRPEDSESSVLRTWKLSFDLISTRAPRAAELLSLMAMLDRQGISKDLLRDEEIRNIDLITALGTLQAFSLISVDKQGSSYEMHRLVQLATQRWLQLQEMTKR